MATVIATNRRRPRLRLVALCAAFVVAIGSLVAYARVRPEQSLLIPKRMADGLGFEPKTALRLYGISSAAPSTGLGHPSPPGKSTGGC